MNVESRVDCIVKGKPVVLIIKVMGVETRFSFKDEIWICSSAIPYWMRSICDFEADERSVDHREWWILTDYQRTDRKCVSFSKNEGDFWFDVRSESSALNHLSTILNISMKVPPTEVFSMHKQAEILVEQLKEVSFLKYDENVDNISPLGRAGIYKVNKKIFKIRRNRLNVKIG